MKVTYYGHSCFSVQISGKTILFDPFIRPNPLAASVDVEGLKPDYIFITHGHGDHIADAVEIAQRSGALVVSNYEVIEWLAKQGVSNGHGLNTGGSKSFEWGKVKFTVAVHSSTMPDGSPGGIPGGFVVESSEGNFFFAGDTALTLDHQLIGRMHKLDFAILPIGDNFTMSAEDAAICAEFIGAEKIMGVHYDSFPPIKIDKDKAKEVFATAGRTLYLPAIGEEIEF